MLCTADDVIEAFAVIICAFSPRPDVLEAPAWALCNAGAF